MIFRFGDIVAVKDLKKFSRPSILVEDTWKYYKKITKGRFGKVIRHNDRSSFNIVVEINTELNIDHLGFKGSWLRRATKKEAIRFEQELIERNI